MGSRRRENPELRYSQTANQRRTVLWNTSSVTVPHLFLGVITNVGRIRTLIVPLLAARSKTGAADGASPPSSFGHLLLQPLEAVLMVAATTVVDRNERLP